MREKRPKQRTTTKDRLADSHEEVHTHTYIHVQPITTATAVKQYKASPRIVYLHSFLIHSGMESVGSTVVDIIIVVVNVVFTLFLLCRDVD